MVYKTIIMDNLFRTELHDVIDKYSKNTRSGVPVEVLTNFVVQTIDNFDTALEQANYGKRRQMEGAGEEQISQRQNRGQG